MFKNTSKTEMKWDRFDINYYFSNKILRIVVNGFEL